MIKYSTILVIAAIGDFAAANLRAAEPIVAPDDPALQKVVTLLDTTKTKIENAMSKELGQHQDFVERCDDNKNEMDTEIKTHKAKLESYTARLAFLNGAIPPYEQAVSKLTSETEVKIPKTYKDKLDKIQADIDLLRRKDADADEALEAVRQAAKVIQEAAGNVMYQIDGSVDPVRQANENKKNQLLATIDASVQFTQLPQKSQKIVRKAMLLAESFGVKAVPKADYNNPQIEERAEYRAGGTGSARQDMVYMHASSGISHEYANVGRNAMYSAYAGAGAVNGVASAEGDAFYNKKIGDAGGPTDGNILSMLTSVTGIISQLKGELSDQIVAKKAEQKAELEDQKAVMDYNLAELTLNRKTLGELQHEKTHRLSDEKITKAALASSEDNLRVTDLRCEMEMAAFTQRSTVQANEVSVLVTASNILKGIVNMNSVPGMCGCGATITAQCVLCSWGYSATPKMSHDICCTDSFDNKFEGGTMKRAMVNEYTQFKSAFVAKGALQASDSCKAWWNPGESLSNPLRCVSAPQYFQEAAVHESHTKALKKQSAATSFAHFQKDAVLSLLQGASESIHGKDLLDVVQVINATRNVATPDDLDFGDVFNSVKQLIKRMIDRLQKTSASDAASLKGDIQTDQEWQEWCTEQISNSETGRAASWEIAFAKNSVMEGAWQSVLSGEEVLKQQRALVDKLAAEQGSAAADEQQAIVEYTDANARLVELQRNVELAKNEIDRFYGAGALAFRGTDVAPTETSHKTTLKTIADPTSGSEEWKVKHWEGNDKEHKRSEYEEDGAAKVGEHYGNEVDTDYSYDKKGKPTKDGTGTVYGYTGEEGMALVIDVLQDAYNDLGKEMAELLSARTAQAAFFTGRSAERSAQSNAAKRLITETEGAIQSEETQYRTAAGVFIKNLVKVEGYGYDIKGLRRGCGNVWMKYSEKKVQRATMCKELSRVLCMLGKSTVGELAACASEQCKYTVLTQ